jgi:hypothetical protein
MMQQIHLFVLPAHTSALTQPLDLSVNHAFKEALRGIGKFPPKREMHNTLVPYVQKIENAISKCLTRKSIIHGLLLISSKLFLLYRI